MSKLHHVAAGLSRRILVALYIIALFLPIPLMPELSRLTEVLLPPTFLLSLVTGIIVCFALVSMVLLWRRDLPAAWLRFVLLVVLAGLAVLWTWNLDDAFAARSIYLPAYGLLAALALFQFGRRDPDVGAYLAAGLLTLLVGTLHELAQWILLDGHFRFPGVARSALGGVGALAFIAIGILPSAYTAPPSPRSLRTVFRLLVAQLLLLGLCVSNTVERMHGYAERIPGLAFLKADNKVMIEYGYRYHDPEIGYFYSRLSMRDLEEQDRTRSAAVASILDAYPFPDRESQFLSTYTPSSDPFVYEVRRRIDRRDRYLAYANRLEPYEYEEWRAPFLTIAYQEHRILELLFPRTWAASGYGVSERNVSRMRTHHDSAVSFHNDTDRHLVTTWREHHFWAGILLILGVAWLCCYRYGAWRMDAPER